MDESEDNLKGYVSIFHLLAITLLVVLTILLSKTTQSNNLFTDTNPDLMLLAADK